VEAPPNMIIAFSLTKFDLARGDYLEIRDGKNEKAVVLKNFTNTSPASEKQPPSTGQFLWVKFKSDNQRCGSGFRMPLTFLHKPFSK